MMNFLKYKIEPRCNLVFIISICFVIILGTTLRLYDLGGESYWFDEVYTVHMAQENVSQLLTVKELNWPPVYYVLIHYWVQFSGTTEMGTRLFSALAGSLSMVFIYSIGRELFGKYVGFFSALLMAISEFQIFYSQETRFYSLFLLMSLLSFFLYIKFIRTGSSSSILAYGLASILLVYCHAFGVFVIAAQNLHFFLQWKKYKKIMVKWFLCQGVIILVIMLYFFPIILKTKQIAGPNAPMLGWIPEPSVLSIFRTVYFYVFPRRHDLSWTFVALNFAAGIAFFLIGVFLFTIGKRKEFWIDLTERPLSSRYTLLNETDELLLAGCWFLCPIVLPFVLSKIIGPMYLDRYTISAAPAFYLLFAFGIVSARRTVPLLVSLITLVILIAPGLQNYYVADIKEQWREAAKYVDTNAQKSDVLVFAPDEGGWQSESFKWYSRSNFQSCGLKQDDLDDQNTLSATLARCNSGNSRFWVISRGSAEVVDSFRSFFLSSKRNDLILVKEKVFTGIDTYLFEIKR